jgi:hypothetical protein
MATTSRGRYQVRRLVCFSASADRAGQRRGAGQLSPLDILLIVVIGGMGTMYGAVVPLSAATGI